MMRSNAEPLDLPPRYGVEILMADFDAWALPHLNLYNWNIFGQITGEIGILVTDNFGWIERPCAATGGVERLHRPLSPRPP